MKYIRVIKLGNIKIRLITNSHFIVNLISEQLSLGRFSTNYKKCIALTLNLKEIKYFTSGRSDEFNINKHNLFLECWLKNIRVNVYPDRNLIDGEILLPTTLPNATVLDLLIIHPLRHILKYKNIFFLHAAALAKNNKGILICGPFKSGKSTLAIKLVEDGLKFLSDEFVIFDKRQLLAFPLKVGLERKSLKMFPKLKGLFKETKKIPEKISFDIQDFYPGCYAKNCIPEMIIFPLPNSKYKKTRIVPINKENAFSLLCLDKDNSLPFEKNLAIRQKQIQTLANIAEKTKAYFLGYALNSIDKASKAVLNLLTQHHSHKAI